MTNPHSTEEVRIVQLTDISPNPWNPHRSSNEEISNIKNSIKEVGQLVPILIAVWDEPIEWDGTVHDPKTEFIIIDGEQRFTALKQLFAEGDNNAFLARCIIIGSVSEYQTWELAEFGQIANHTRGSIEDDLKTGKLMSEILKNRDLSSYTRIVSQRAEYLTKAVDLVKRKETKELRDIKTSTKVEGITAHTSNRGYYTVSLPFESANDVQEFEALLSKLPDVEKSYKGLSRSYKLLEMLRTIKDDEDDEEGGR